MKRIQTPLLLILLTALLGGCIPVIPWIEAVFAPDKVVPPEYDVPRDARMLVLVTDVQLADIATAARLKRELTKQINIQMLHYNVVYDVVAYEDIQNLIATDRNFYDMMPGEIAAKLDADLVLHVRIDQFALKDSEYSTLWSGRLKSRIRLLSLDDDLLWPKDRPTGLAMPETKEVTYRDTTETYGVQMTETLAKNAATDIVKCFREYTVPQNIHERPAPVMDTDF